MDNFKINERVAVLGKISLGTIAFIGNTHFSDGLWYGIVLDEPNGRNNGTYDGVSYFKCYKNHGIFVRLCQIRKIHTSSASNKVHKVSSRKFYPNYLRDESLLKLGKKRRNNEAKKAPKKSHGELALKRMAEDLQKVEDFSNAKQDEKDRNVRTITTTDGDRENVIAQAFQKTHENSPIKKGNKVAKIKKSPQRLKNMINKTNRELNEIKSYIIDLDRKIELLKALSLREGGLFGYNPQKSLQVQN
ncbi:centrosome-associated protein 350 [Caerostris darwini]|uniref:Centrosome-associated protein 350 n=1 Tax=Caerostris darwini TaxID=1538125 RepID=A0AAV4NMH8_9ARAC|nr:centrosome-associated protein 350 [Caerostris darwini]